MCKKRRSYRMNLKKSDKGFRPEDIFTQSMWCNPQGHKAINAKKNREYAEGVMLLGQTYFSEHFPGKHPEVHTDMVALMASDHKLKAVAYPRGHSKSTIVTFLLVLYRIIFHERKFIVIVSDSEDKAKDFVVRIKSELEFNQKLIRDFSPGGKDLKEKLVGLRSERENHPLLMSYSRMVR